MLKKVYSKPKVVPGFGGAKYDVFGKGRQKDIVGRVSDIRTYTLETKHDPLGGSHELVRKLVK